MARFRSIRIVVSAAFMSAAMLAMTVAQVFAGSGSGPFPR